MDLTSLWSKIPRGTSTDFKFLSWQARGIMSEIWRQADRQGLVDLGRRGLPGITAIIGAGPTEWSTVRPFVEELFTSGLLEYSEDAHVLTVRGFEEYQGSDAGSTSTERMRRLRQRKREGSGGDACDADVTGGDGRDVTATGVTSPTAQGDERREEKKRSEEKRSPLPPKGGDAGVTAAECWQAILSGAGAALMYTETVKRQAPQGGFLPSLQQTYFSTAAAEALRAGEGLASFKRLGEYIQAGALHWQRARAPWDQVARELTSMLSAAEKWERDGRPDPKTRGMPPERPHQTKGLSDASDFKAAFGPQGKSDGRTP